jgi:predicted transcriptional regulator
LELETATLPDGAGISGRVLAAETAGTLQRLAAEIESGKIPPRLEDLERRLAVLEEKLFAVLMAVTPDDQIVSVRAEADRELSPYRSKMPAAQIQQLQKQYLNKKLLEKYKLPRLSLFYL